LKAARANREIIRDSALTTHDGSLVAYDCLPIFA
jgi:hypothetical protein